MAYEHLHLEREAPLTERHPRQYRGSTPPANPREYGFNLRNKFDRARQIITEGDIGGFDERKLLKIKLHKGDKSVPAFHNIPGIEVVSQEDEAIILAFATEAGLNEFESRLATLMQDGSVTRKELLYAIEDFDRWTPDDRTGSALREQGFPETSPFIHYESCTL